MNNIATLIVSFDVELGWGAVENGKWKEKEAKGIYRATRLAVSSLLAIFEETEIPATWCFVGKLLDEESLYSEWLPAAVRQVCKMKGDEKTWRGIDLLNRITDTDVPHEVGCHSFYHCRTRADFMTSKFFDEEISLCRCTFGKMGLAPESFVFPSNEERWTSVLAEKGFTSFRGKNHHEWINTSNSAARKCLSLLRMTGIRPIRTEIPTQEKEGLWRLPGTVLFTIPLKRRRFLPGLIRRVKRGLKGCVSSGGYFHIWCHPYSFAQNPGLLDGFREVLALAAEMRNTDRLHIHTMKDFVGRYSY